MSHKLKQALDEYDAHMNAIGGCTDGFCLIKKPKGMHTNGGCKCLDDKYKARRHAYAANKLRDVVQEFVTIVTKIPC